MLTRLPVDKQTARSAGAEIRAEGRRRWDRRALTGIGALVLVLVVAYLAFCACTATRATIPGRDPLKGTPADVGLRYEPVQFESAVDHVRLQGWYVPASGERAIVMVHGINGNRWGRIEPELTRWYADHGYDVMLFDLRGHGESDPARVGFGWFERRDLQAAVGVVEAHGVPAGKIGAFGVSYGAATALLTAAVTPDISVVVADSSWADVRDQLAGELRLATGLPPVFVPGVGLFTQAFYGLNLAEIAPERWVGRIAPRPILFIHGTGDTRTPYTQSVRLKAAARGPADELWLVQGAEHSKSFEADKAAYMERVVSFFDHVLR
jgi:dipeptidyl aminopeptidase/acylaminoacyl peptidase